MSYQDHWAGIRYYIIRPAQQKANKQRLEDALRDAENEQDQVEEIIEEIIESPLNLEAIEVETDLEAPLTWIQRILKQFKRHE